MFSDITGLNLYDELQLPYRRRMCAALCFILYPKQNAPCACIPFPRGLSLYMYVRVASPLPAWYSGKQYIYALLAKSKNRSRFALAARASLLSFFCFLLFVEIFTIAEEQNFFLLEEELGFCCAIKPDGTETDDAACCVTTSIEKNITIRMMSLLPLATHRTWDFLLECFSVFYPPPPPSSLSWYNVR